ncbi:MULTISPECIES: hypothetical protein [Bradyrhizobium]|uniref:hypothetical protein n=1 Tax=Bradyrhizobium TaxID=374 RepID=UPI001EDC535F|nr:hypothetical protein [Bradyrhizobium zhengyangense]MCG2643763.1 hypothetical protein [Bradyrhizobium zhengyangense]
MVLIGFGEAVASWPGGAISERLRNYDVRWSLWFVAIVFMVARPFAMAFYYVGDVKWAMALFLLPTASASVRLRVVHHSGRPRNWAARVGALSQIVSSCAVLSSGWAAPIELGRRSGNPPAPAPRIRFNSGISNCGHFSARQSSLICKKFLIVPCRLRANCVFP